DTNSNKFDPDTPDRMYRAQRSGAKAAWTGIGTNKDGQNWAAWGGSGATIGATIRPGGFSAEFRIPFSDLPGLTGQGEVVGFAVFALDDGNKPYAAIPSFATPNNASSWSK